MMGRRDMKARRGRKDHRGVKARRVMMGRRDMKARRGRKDHRGVKARRVTKVAAARPIAPLAHVHAIRVRAIQVRAIQVQTIHVHVMQADAIQVHAILARVIREDADAGGRRQVPRAHNRRPEVSSYPANRRSVA